MASISSAGIGSGLDVTGLVDKLVSAEGEPTIKRLDRREATFQLQISSIGMFKSALIDFKSSLSPLSNPAIFNSKTSLSADEEVVSVSAENSAEIAEYAIQVEKLASSARLASTSFTSENDTVGSGQLIIEFGEYQRGDGQFVANTKKPSISLQIDNSNGSLQGIMQEINQADKGVRAGIVDDGTGKRLVLNSVETGASYDIRIRVIDDDGINTDTSGLSSLAFDDALAPGQGNNMQRTSSAENAVIYVDGLRVESSKNVFEQAVKGISITANSVSDRNIKVAIDHNYDGIRDAIKGFIEAYNALMAATNELTGYNPETGESGALSGDASVRGVIDQLRRIMGSSYNDINDTAGSLSAIGISTDRSGMLLVDESKLMSAISNSGDEVVNLFTRNVSASDPMVRIVNADRISADGRYGLEVMQQATSAVYQSGVVASFPVQINNADDAFSINVDGTSSGVISLPTGQVNSGNELAGLLELMMNRDNQLQAANKLVSANFINNRIVITSNATGSQSSLNVNNVTADLVNLGLVAAEGQPGQDVIVELGGNEFTGTGRRVDFDGFARGLSVEIEGQTGSRGEIVFSNGIAARLDDVIGRVLSEQGVVSARQQGLTARLDDIARQRDNLSRRLEKIEERYLKQFTALDAMLGRMRQTSEYLGNQLAALPGAKQPNKQ